MSKMSPRPMQDSDGQATGARRVFFRVLTKSRNGAREFPLAGRGADANADGRLLQWGLRRCQRPMAFWPRPRQIVAPLSRAPCDGLRGFRGRCRLAPSPARALDGATRSERYGGRPSGSRFILQTGWTFLKESLAPLADDRAWDREAGGNLIIGAALSGQKDNLGADDRIVRCRIFPGHGFQGGLPGLAQSNGVWAFTRHNIAHSSQGSLADNRRRVKAIIRYTIILTPRRGRR